MALATNDVTFANGRSGVFFTMADETTFPLVSPDVSLSAVYANIEFVYLSCNSVANPTLVDGSSGDKILGLVCTSVAGGSQAWDFRDSPLRTLGKDSTEVLCISVSTACDVKGFIKWYPAA